MFAWNQWFDIFASLALKSAAVTAAAWMLSALLRRNSAAARHLVWTAAFAALLALPLLSLTLPPWRLPVRQLATTIASETVTATPEAAAPAAGIAALHRALPASEARIPQWRMLVLLLCGAGAALSFARMLAASVVIRRMRRGALPLPSAAAAAGVPEGIAVLTIAHGSMPMTSGLFRPAIFLPAEASEWTPQCCRFVLLHELAHIERGDIATHLLARTALALYWWNPLAWIAWGEFLKEREAAADDLVLGAGARASEYAGVLLDIARSFEAPAAIRAAAVPMARRSRLEGRVLAILDSARCRRAANRASLAAAALLAAVVVAPLSALKAQNGAAQPADVKTLVALAASQQNYQMLDRAARTAEASRDYALAQQLREASLSIRERVSGSSGVAYGEGLMNLGALELRRKQPAEARNLYQRAAAVLGDGKEAAPALLHLGVSAIMKKDYEQAANYFQRAKLLDPGNAGEASMWLAVVREKQNNIQEADWTFQQAIALAAASEQSSAAPVEPPAFSSATARRIYAQFMREQGREDDAKALEQRAGGYPDARSTDGALAAARAANPSAYRIGNGVTAPRVLSKVEPEYTDEARAAHLQGTEMVYVEIGLDGVPRNMAVVRPLGLGLDQNGLDAISQWRFQPAEKDGAPVTVSATIEVNWRLL